MMQQCPVCNRPLGRRNKICCSMACYAVHKSNYKKCVICGKTFQVPPSAQTVTCGTECSHDNRKRMAADGVNAPALEKAHAAAQTSPLAGPYETHINAKEWVIQSPDGQTFRCRNLKLWLRKHEDMLDGTPQQAFDGFTRMRATAEGRRKKGLLTQWKGWKLIDYGE